MRKRLTGVIVLALLIQVAALTAPASATMAILPPGELQTNDDTTLLLTSDKAVLPPTLTVETDDLGPIGPAIPIDDVGGPLAPPVDMGMAFGRYCKRVTLTMEYRLRGSEHVAFYYRLTKDFCWNTSTHKVSSVQAHASGHVYSWATPQWQYEGTTDSDDYYYQYFSGIPQSGHYSYRAGRFTAHCGPFYCGSRNPKLIIRAHGDGTFSHWSKG